MNSSLAVRWLAAAVVALLALALPLKGAGADGLARHGVQAPSPGAHLVPRGHRSPVHGGIDRLRFESDLRHYLRSQALKRGHGAREVVILGRGLSPGRSHDVIAIQRHAFPALVKGGIFGSPRPQTLVFVRTRDLRGPLSGAAARAQPRKIMAHGGHGLYDPRAELFGGLFGGPGRAPGRHARLPGIHPRVLVVEPAGE